MPGADIGKCVGADYEKQLVSGRHARTHFFDGVDGITPRGALFQPGHFHVFESAARDLGHTDAMFVGRVCERVLMRRIGRRHQQNTIQAASFDSLLGDGQVGPMNGIESTAEDRQSHSVELCPLDFDRVDLDFLYRPVRRTARDFGNFVHHVVAFHYFPEYAVLLVEPWRGAPP